MLRGQLHKKLAGIYFSPRYWACVVKQIIPCDSLRLVAKRSDISVLWGAQAVLYCFFNQFINATNGLAEPSVADQHCPLLLVHCRMYHIPPDLARCIRDNNFSAHLFSVSSESDFAQTTDNAPPSGPVISCLWI